MKVLITGSEGFIGKNISIYLRERGFQVLPYTRSSSLDLLSEHVLNADAVIHLACEIRPKDPQSFISTNVELTNTLCGLMRSCKKKIPVIYASSIQAKLANPYGESKLKAEKLFESLQADMNLNLAIYRLPNVFGKWSKPNYNSVVATFCYNIAHGLPIEISDPSKALQLVYIDDVLASFLKFLLDTSSDLNIYHDIETRYIVTLSELAELIYKFKNYRETLFAEEVGSGFVRALYSTYLSYLPVSDFNYPLFKNIDDRGEFVEILKTRSSGQISYFTAHPGITRGGHYHHTKTEKFLVIRGQARFKFRHIATGESYELFVSGESPEVVDTVPGWSHDITNIGENELVVVLWANELFDPENPDTVAMRLS